MGYELITQPTVFYGPISALGGIYPSTGTGTFTLSSSFTTFFEAWSLTGDDITTNFSIYTDDLILPYSENFIVTVDGVFQPPNFYTIDAYNKQILFTNPIPNGSIANVVQIATVKESLSGNYLPTTGGTLVGSLSTTQTIYASALQLNQATVLPGESLTSSISSLLININGQQFKVPLLAL
jgi:hypothetical protein